MDEVEVTTSLMKTVDWFVKAETLLRSSVLLEAAWGLPDADHVWVVTAYVPPGASVKVVPFVLYWTLKSLGPVPLPV
jgi:hypothetical protein